MKQPLFFFPFSLYMVGKLAYTTVSTENKLFKFKDSFEICCLNCCASTRRRWRGKSRIAANHFFDNNALADKPLQILGSSKTQPDLLDTVEAFYSMMLRTKFGKERKKTLKKCWKYWKKSDFPQLENKINLPTYLLAETTKKNILNGFKKHWSEEKQENRAVIEVFWGLQDSASHIPWVTSPV